MKVGSSTLIRMKSLRVLCWFILDFDYSGLSGYSGCFKIKPLFLLFHKNSILEFFQAMNIIFLL